MSKISSKAEIGVNGLVFGNADEVVNEVESLLRAGYSSIKIKVGKIFSLVDLLCANLLFVGTESGLLAVVASERWT